MVEPRVAAVFDLIADARQTSAGVIRPRDEALRAPQGLIAPEPTTIVLGGTTS
jgi:hypothetical protein